MIEMEEYIPLLLQLQAQTQVWHWQTNKYATHVALGGYYEAIQGFSDKLIEVTKGKNPNGAIPGLKGKIALEIFGIDGNDLIAQYSTWAQQLEEIAKSEEIATQPDIQDIFLDMINETNKLVYLLRLS